jgi:hypothetical protein
MADNNRFMPPPTPETLPANQPTQSELDEGKAWVIAHVAADHDRTQLEETKLPPERGAK